jgi:hypothetical protein
MWGMKGGHCMQREGGRAGHVWMAGRKGSERARRTCVQEALGRVFQPLRHVGQQRLAGGDHARLQGEGEREQGERESRQGET